MSFPRGKPFPNALCAERRDQHRVLVSIEQAGVVLRKCKRIRNTLLSAFGWEQYLLYFSSASNSRGPSPFRVGELTGELFFSVVFCVFPVVFCISRVVFCVFPFVILRFVCFFVFFVFSVFSVLFFVFFLSFS